MASQLLMFDDHLATIKVMFYCADRIDCGRLVLHNNPNDPDISRIHNKIRKKILDKQIDYHLYLIDKQNNEQIIKNQNQMICMWFIYMDLSTL